ncbi:MAG: FecR domain-containing protein [Candidatus Omnitrophica bacterium]|nr:FecR domain-containing protein [Candidatus Omnitrophota bacterium]
MKITKIITVILAVSFLCANSHAEFAKRSAEIVDMEGTGQVIAPNMPAVPAEVGMVLTEGYVVKTGAESWIMFNLVSDQEPADVEMKENTEMFFSELLLDAQEGVQKTLLDLAIGEILITSKKLQSEKSKFEVKTPTSIIGVRGTSFSVSVEAE